MPYSSPTPAIHPARVKALAVLALARSAKVLRSRAKAAPPLPSSETIEGRADPARYGRGPLRLGADCIAEKVGAAPFYSCPIEVPLDAENEGIPLIICAEGTAAQKARATCERVVCAERIAPRRSTGARPYLAADIEPGPAIDCRRRGSDRCAQQRQIGGEGCSRAEREACDRNERAGDRQHRRRTLRRSSRTPYDVPNSAPLMPSGRGPNLFGRSVVSWWPENDFEFLA